MTLAALRGEKYQAEANRAFSMMLRRAGEWARAERVWLEMVRRRQLGAWPLTELAKYYEHRAGRLHDALQMTETALAIADTGNPRGALSPQAAAHTETGGKRMNIMAEFLGRKAYNTHLKGNAYLDKKMFKEAEEKHAEALEAYAKAMGGRGREPQAPDGLRGAFDAQVPV